MKTVTQITLSAEELIVINALMLIGMSALLARAVPDSLSAKLYPVTLAVSATRIGSAGKEAGMTATSKIKSAIEAQEAEANVRF